MSSDLMCPFTAMDWHGLCMCALATLVFIMLRIPLCCREGRAQTTHHTCCKPVVRAWTQFLCAHYGAAPAHTRTAGVTMQVAAPAPEKNQEVSELSRYG